MTCEEELKKAFGEFRMEINDQTTSLTPRLDSPKYVERSDIATAVQNLEEDVLPLARKLDQYTESLRVLHEINRKNMLKLDGVEELIKKFQKELAKNYEAVEDVLKRDGIGNHTWENYQTFHNWVLTRVLALGEAIHK